MGDAELTNMVRRVVDGNLYLTLGTVEPDGLPRLSPVYFTHDAYRTFYWLSAPDAQHSRNVARQPEITAVIYDSSVIPGDNPQAVYLTATAQRVPDDELTAECAVAFRTMRGGIEASTPEDLTAPAPLRLYRATATSYAVHIRGSHPTRGRGTDSRVPVTMP
ncbi:pyridoxamine 5'-phosphate oxidase family protein [Streptomyces sp. B6B3]|uniref:pyridoxamine 5'-phosphate oxidase family protein n=1 Tax=Streptomyces sp. B6B3 TaxID=3153570 RepID=UPI00325D712A